MKKRGILVIIFLIIISLQKTFGLLNDPTNIPNLEELETKYKEKEPQKTFSKYIKNGKLKKLHFFLLYCALKNKRAIKIFKENPLFLGIAIKYNQLGMVQYLVEKINFSLNSDLSLMGLKITPLHEAAVRGRFNIVNYMLKKQPNTISARDNNNYTPLDICLKEIERLKQKPHVSNTPYQTNINDLSKTSEYLHKALLFRKSFF